MHNGAIVVSSETCAFEVAKQSGFGINPGEVVIIDDNGITYDNYTTDTQLAVCSMEYITLPAQTPISSRSMSIQLVNVWGLNYKQNLNIGQRYCGRCT